MWSWGKFQEHIISQGVENSEKNEKIKVEEIANMVKISAIVVREKVIDHVLVIN